MWNIGSNNQVSLWKFRAQRSRAGVWSTLAKTAAAVVCRNGRGSDSHRSSRLQWAPPWCSGHIWTQQHWQPWLGGTASSHRLILVLFLASMALWPSGDPLINSFSSSVSQSSFSVAWNWKDQLIWVMFFYKKNNKDIHHDIVRGKYWRPQECPSVGDRSIMKYQVNG